MKLIRLFNTRVELHRWQLAAIEGETRIKGLTGVMQWNVIILLLKYDFRFRNRQFLY